MAKIDELMTLVDKFETQMLEQDKLAESYAEAWVASFTGTQFERTQKMKTPKTQLSSDLVLDKAPRPGDRAPLAAILHSRGSRAPAKEVWIDSQLEIEEFYQQLKREIAGGWIASPEEAVMNEVAAS